MKKISVMLMIMALLAVTLGACSSNKNKEVEVKVRENEQTATPTNVEKGDKQEAAKDPYAASWYGVGIYSRCMMTTSKEGNIISATVIWGDSANTSFQYQFSGELQNNILSYDNLVEKEVVVDDADKQSEKVINEKGSGEVFFHDNVILWDNNGETVVLSNDESNVQDASKEAYSGAYGGIGLYERVSMEFTQKDAQVSATIHWSDSASEAVEYTFSGTIDGNQAILENIKTIAITYKEDGTKKEEVQAENGTGTIFFNKNCITVMSDSDDFVIPFVK